ncbi:glyoxalase/bleomycin resistance/extradiol dioxygenase family protein [Pleomorphomonas diazotrophica]|uniref:Glyoxalase/bleomycin resistance/extradiol dioxygenase family protein n=1 Tax=Pleomorphomonas diazotrophica TaxID=1166257 RepID=A0A1I4QBZ3_9HYPH|nr:VOC family protein [Pleomorphomonas diazotrophica]PKR90777.1 glyoxalase/bleomycin resistance/extradiol dioxygenase family protein [Pleomorphomonas diazotrophica]SFM37621.1 Catechol 2,3-dioxygenase [Pleomorphomonas diazotrophica]
MFDHIDCPVTDIRRSVTFYDALLAPLGLVRLITRLTSAAGGASNAGYGRDGHAGFWLSDASRKGRLHVGFSAATREAVEAFHAAGLAAGGTDNGAPGLRPYAANYFAAYIIDPDGHNIEAVCRAAG